ncbi:hypothetical protein MNBD_PLANCTO02-1468 [hydrothermal vent metagenome]|uniref:ABC transporter permease n=1 Tax=hydrothermal vent metagenome TaxID=652676 RepID=A0A3B1D2D8_9ZZZZ
MEYDPVLFEIVPALMEWLAVFASLFVVGTVIAFLASFIHYGTDGPIRFINGLGTSLFEIVTPAPRRIFALATLTFREAIRNKILLVFVLFAILFMFAGWFMSSSKGRPDLEVAINVSFVLKVISILVMIVLLLLSCWGIPADIKARSLHTVVTKPVTYMEIILGRFFGYLSVGTVILLIMAGIGYTWILRQTPNSVEKEYLICRVPEYGNLSFIDTFGRPAKKGINVGDIWEYRSFIQGGSKARAIWVFEDVSKDDLVTVKKYDKVKKKDVVVGQFLQLESRFGVFRTHKGNINKGVIFRYTLLNDKGTKTEDDDLKVPLTNLESNEFKEQVTSIPLTIKYRLNTKKTKNKEYTANLFDDLVSDGKLIVEVECSEGGQNIGMGKADLFIRTPDKPFWIGYSKAILSIWLMLMLVVALGVSASTFAKGPVATLAVVSFVIVGLVAYEHLDHTVKDWKAGKLQGGGAIESVHRIVTHKNPSTKIEDGTGKKVMKTADIPLFYLLQGMSKIIPNLSKFKAIEWVSKGYDVPWRTSLFHAIAITAGFSFPALLLGFFSLKYRELESK